MSRPQPEQVFTPRSASVNEATYVDRPDLEKELARAVRGTQHIIIYGNSGTGKSWLFKRVFAAESVHYAVANMATALLEGSVGAALDGLVDRQGRSRKLGYDEKKSAEANVVVAKASVDHTGKYALGQKTAYERALEFVRSGAGSQNACLVLDNFEQILGSEELERQATALLVLLDDEAFGQYDVKLVIVAAPDDISMFFSRLKAMQTVANRTSEMPEVGRLGSAQADDLVEKGFVTQLRCEFADITLQEVQDRVSWVTDRIPQYIQEFCLLVAQEAADSGHVVQREHLPIAEQRWLQKSLRSAYTAVEARMNAYKTEVGRRNQTLYALSCLDGAEFRYTDVEPIVRKVFAGSTRDKQLNIPQLLSKLSAGDNPVLRRTPRGDAYQFVSPLYRLCLRTMLYVDDETGQVRKVELR